MDRYYLLGIKERVAFTVFVLGAPIDLIYEYHVTKHYIESVYQTTNLHILFYGYLIFSAVQVFCNLYNVTTSDNRTKLCNTYTITGDGGDQDICVICRRVQTDQSHHCKICNVCIERRDHHCWFAGNCIGEKNQRYFIVMCGYLWSVAIIENIYNLRFVCDILGCDVYSILTICIPHFPVLLREYTLYHLLINFLTFLGLLLLVLFTGLIYSQASQLISGRTKHEIQKGIPPKEETTLTQNITRLLGKRWVLVWIWPFVDSDTRQYPE